jgi:hypothetical protein
MTDETQWAGQLDPDERWVDERLTRERPIPPAAFRGALGRRLAADDPGYGPRPQRLWVMVTAYAATAALLMVLGLLQATGAL